MHLSILFLFLLLNNFTELVNFQRGESMIKDNFIILSGCSGGGKSTLLSELEKLGFSVVPEPGRQIVQEQLAIDGEALPWVDLPEFLEKALEKNIQKFKSIKSTKPVFFDRSIVDTMTSVSKDSPFLKAAKKYRYHKKVFFTPPWKEIYKNDDERKHSFEEAITEYNRLIKNYKALGYEVLILPKVSVSKRIYLVLKELNLTYN